MRHIFLLLIVVSAQAYAADNIDLEIIKKNNKPVSNVKFEVTDNFKFDSNTTITKKALLNGEYDSDIGAVYKLTSVDSVRISTSEEKNAFMVNYRHKF